LRNDMMSARGEAVEGGYREQADTAAAQPGY
jgi:hypothetical protein